MPISETINGPYPGFIYTNMSSFFKEGELKLLIHSHVIPQQGRAICSAHMRNIL